MNLEEHILHALTIAGTDGLTMKDLSRQVYNSCNDFFNPVDFDTVRHEVALYLSRSIKHPDSIVIKGEGRGVYCLNMNSWRVRQLHITFEAKQEEQQDCSECADQSLSLFE